MLSTADWAASSVSELKALPNVSFIGRSNSGKTTLLEKLIAELTRRGLKVATVKHHSHAIDLDKPGKDSWRHAQAGAAVTMLASPGQLGIMRHMPDEGEASLDDINKEAQLAGCDLLITEGFKRIGLDRIELVRAARSQELVSNPDDIIALVTDHEPLIQEYEGRFPIFGLEDIERLADFIVQRYGV